MNAKTIKYEVTREIEWLPVQGDICAYRETELLNGEPVSEKEGISTLSVLENANTNDGIPSFTSKIKHGMYPAYLCTPAIFDAYNNNWFGTDDYYSSIRQALIANPYTYVLENGSHGIHLMVPCHFDGNLFDLNGKVYPIGLHFDYNRAGFDNSRYDLSTAMETLLKRNDIIWLNGHGIPSEPKIHAIPVYNEEPGRTHFLNFAWVPAEEDFDKIRDIYLAFKDDALRAAPDIVFGIPKRKQVLGTYKDPDSRIWQDINDAEHDDE